MLLPLSLDAALVPTVKTLEVGAVLFHGFADAADAAVVLGNK